MLGPGDRISARTDNPKGMRFLLAAGRPIGEPVVQHGPFVMNTQARLLPLQTLCLELTGAPESAVSVHILLAAELVV